MSMHTAPASTVLSDDEIFDQAARLVSRPKEAPANSFQLHAPLELLARRILLDRVDPARRELARQRITRVAETYAHSGQPVADAGDAPPSVPPPDELVASLAAAAHAPIYFSLLPRVSPNSRAATTLVRPLARELGRHPDWRIEWVDEGRLRGSGDTHALPRAL